MFPGAFKRRWTLRWAVGRIITALVIALVFLVSDYVRAAEPITSYYITFYGNTSTGQTAEQACAAFAVDNADSTHRENIRNPRVATQNNVPYCEFDYDDRFGPASDSIVINNRQICEATGESPNSGECPEPEPQCQSGELGWHNEIISSDQFASWTPATIYDSEGCQFTPVLQDDCGDTPHDQIINDPLGKGVGRTNDGALSVNIAYCSTGQSGTPAENDPPPPNTEPDQPTPVNETVEPSTETETKAPETSEASDGSTTTVEETITTTREGESTTIEADDYPRLAIYRNERGRVEIERVTVTTEAQSDGTVVKTTVRELTEVANQSRVREFDLDVQDGDYQFAGGGSTTTTTRTVTTTNPDGSSSSSTTQETTDENGGVENDAPIGSGDGGDGGDGDGEGEEFAGADLPESEDMGTSYGRLIDAVYDSELVAPLKALQNVSGSGSCPTASFTIFDRELTIDMHCTILNDPAIQGALSSVFMALWALLAIFIFFMA